jgi:hypothetical protein
MLSKHPLAIPLGTAALVVKAQAIGDVGLAVVAALVLIILALLVLDRDASFRSKGPHGTITHTLSFPKRPSTIRGRRRRKRS